MHPHLLDSITTNHLLLVFVCVFFCEKGSRPSVFFFFSKLANPAYATSKVELLL